MKHSLCTGSLIFGVMSLVRVWIECENEEIKRQKYEFKKRQGNLKSQNLEVTSMDLKSK